MRTPRRRAHSPSKLRCRNHIHLPSKLDLTAWNSRWQLQQDEAEVEEMRQRQQKALVEKQTRRRQAEVERKVRDHDVISKVALVCC